ncbi:MAG: SUMF1/EgtB/PvdO family nonheme iron enzyme [Terriglobales bacterium]
MPVATPSQAPLRLEYEAACAASDRLFRRLVPSALYDRPIPERHRLIFYLGHLEAFDWNLIGKITLGAAPIDASLDGLFAFGIDPPIGQLPSDRPRDWPRPPAVAAYRRRVRRALRPLWREAPVAVLATALEHRLMHLETLAYLLHQLPPQKKRFVLETPILRPAPAERLISIPAGVATLGRRRGDGFGWDNEFGLQRERVPAFAIGRNKVTNEEYSRFVAEGAPPPGFWRRRRDGWRLRVIGGEVPLPLDWPVYVTQREAAAYARWRGKALPTEAQFHRAAYGAPAGERRFPWGDAPPRREHGNFDRRRWDPVGVETTPAGDSAWGVAQLVGNGWEWTATPFGPFPGFTPYSFYPGYSRNFFDGQHYVIKGGAPQTASRLLRRSFRNWFRPDYPYVHAGFRLVEN